MTTVKQVIGEETYCGREEVLTDVQKTLIQTATEATGNGQ